VSIAEGKGVSKKREAALQLIHKKRPAAEGEAKTRMKTGVQQSISTIP